MDQNIKIAVVLSAVDKMTAIVNGVVAQTSAKLSTLQKFSERAASASTAYGRESIRTGMIAASPLVAAAKAYGDQEEALLGMRAAMMEDGNRLDEAMYTRLTKYAQNTSQRLTGTTEDYLKMIRVLQENSISPKEILGGIGDSVANLSVFFKMAPDEIAQFAARMRQDMGVLPKEMGGMMDFIARLNKAGVGKNGPEAVAEMSEAFSKAGLGAHNLGVIGLQASKDLGALMAIFIRRGISGQTVGNNFRRIFDGLRDADKVRKMNDEAKKLGLTLDFYDKDGKFKGIAAFTAELDKLKGLTTPQISAILKPFGGKQGLSTDFLEFLGKEGTASFNTMQEKLSRQATLTARVSTMMAGLNNQFTIAKTTAINAAAAVGATYAPQLKKLFQDLNKTLIATIQWVNTHKELVSNIARAIAYFAAWKIGSGALALVFGTVFKSIGQIVQVIRFALPLIRFLSTGLIRLGVTLFTTVLPAVWGAITATWAWTAALLANPITWIVLAVIALAAAAVLVFKKWDPISKWFGNVWKSIKAGIAGALAVMKLFLDVLIGAGKVYLGLFTFNPAMIKEGFAQGSKAIQSIANGGISKAFNQAYDVSIKGGKPTANTATPVAPTSKSGTNFHFQPIINLHGGATPEHGKMLADSMKPHFDKWYRDKKHDDARLAYK